MSRDVQESILQKGITLVFDMKLHRLERVARCTGSPILSCDTLAAQKLRQCDSFHFEKFIEEHAISREGGRKPNKTLMFIEGCPTRLGCTVSEFHLAHFTKSLNPFFLSFESFESLGDLSSMLLDFLVNKFTGEFHFKDYHVIDVTEK